MWMPYTHSVTGERVQGKSCMAPLISYGCNAIQDAKNKYLGEVLYTVSPRITQAA